MIEQFINRLCLLQKYLQDNVGCHAFFVPRVDRYQGEYVVEADERLAWLTGFTGSAGLAIIMPDEVALFVDGRYTLQARQQVPLDQVKVIHSGEISPFSYLESRLPNNAIVAYDPWLHTAYEKQQWLRKTSRLSWQFTGLDKNPVDQLWLDRPQRPLHPVFLLDHQFTGKSSQAKIEDVRAALVNAGADLTYIGAPDALCWLLNIRGSDFPYTPLVDAMAFLDRGGYVTLVIDPVKVPEEVQRSFEGGVKIIPETGLLAFLKNQKDRKILAHVSSMPVWIWQFFTEGQLIIGDDLIQLPKACKNEVEQAGMHQAHVKDGLAVVKFLHWLSKNTDPLTELDVVERLEAFRAEGENYRGPSFPTIAGYGSNGAIVHYRPHAQTNKVLQDGSLLLLDSGGQYLEGTTDITRTIALGGVHDEHCEYFTRVLKGHIALATVHFPKGTSGIQLDVLARQPLWQTGADFDHGTGHGVGCFLNVHEGPQRISKAGSSVPLQPGMILSNEPGYYKANKYGIRIENLMLVRSSNLETDRSFYCFETLTLVPIETRLIIIEWLTAAEREWLNTYHQKIRDHLLPHLEPETAAWLMEATEPV